MGLGCIGSVGVLAVTMSPTAAFAEVRVPSNPRILVVGDSISHGFEGDFTWRYRLKEHLTKSGVDADFVIVELGFNDLVWGKRMQPAFVTISAN